MAIRVDGATHIGTAKGYDLFDIRTYAAAQQFINVRTQAEAGADFTQNEDTFNRNITDTVKLYFFVLINTNEVKYAVLKTAGSPANTDLTLKSSVNTSVEIQTNFVVEDSRHHSEIAAGDTVPLFLLPEYAALDVDAKGCLIDRDSLRAVLPQFCESGLLKLDMSVEPYVSSVREIASDAFCFGQDISELILTDNITVMPENVISRRIESIHLTCSETPSHWHPRWHNGREDRITFNYGLSDEERASLEAEARAREEEAERQRQAEAERAAREAELAAEREARKIRYKVEGNSITIKGTRKGIEELDIPEEIDGKPVTKIEAYAFFENPYLKKLKLPKTLKIVERGAFYGLNLNQMYIKVPKGCIIGKDNPPNVRRVDMG